MAEGLLLLILIMSGDADALDVVIELGLSCFLNPNLERERSYEVNKFRFNLKANA
jgi:hypothetical protein